MQAEMNHWSKLIDPHLTRERSVKELREILPDIGENQLRRVLLARVACGEVVESIRITGGPGGSPKVYRLADGLERNRIFTEGR